MTVPRMAGRTVRVGLLARLVALLGREDAAAVEVPTRHTGRARNRQLGLLSTLCAHTTAPYTMDLYKETLRPLKRFWAARALSGRRTGRA
jgi:hypothetical protein